MRSLVESAREHVEMAREPVESAGAFESARAIESTRAIQSTRTLRKSLITMWFDNTRDQETKRRPNRSV